MIITITPNPAVDEVYSIDNFAPGKWYRAEKVTRAPGGRGINVSIILKQLGYDSVAAGFLAGHAGSYIKDYLHSKGITTNFVNISGENRADMFIKDEAAGVETAIMEEGPRVLPGEIERFYWNLERILLPRATAVYMGGSLPPGAPEDFYKETVDRVRRKNIPVYIDASGSPLDLAIEALPTVIRIDERFAGERSEVPPGILENMMEVSKRIFDEGVDWIVTSYFKRSSLFCTTKGFFLAEIKKVKPVTYRAASDALTAGMILAREERMGIEDTIKFCMSCMLQTISCPQKGLPSREAVESSLSEITIEKL